MCVEFFTSFKVDKQYFHSLEYFKHIPMRRAIILVVLLFASFSFLLLQLLSFRGLDEESSWTSKIGKAMRFGFTKRQENPSWKNFHSISQTIQEFNLKAFLIEPDMLQDLVINDIAGDSSLWNLAPQFFQSGCRYVCGRKRILLGVFDDQWAEMRDNFEIALVKEGFQSNCCKDQDPRAVTVDRTIHSSIDLHCAFTKAGVTIDFVIFYKRQEFLWHGTVSEKHHQQMPGLVFGKSTGAFNNFKLKQSKIDDITVWTPKRPNNFLNEMKSSRFIECNVKRAQEFYAKYGEERNDDEEQFRVVVRTILETAKTALDDLGVRFWLSSGTCLGWYRQCGVIPYSKDVDIGIWIKDYDPRLIERFDKYGLVLKHKFGKVEDSFELSFRPRDGSNAKLDIFFFYEEKDFMWNGGTQAKSGKKFKYIFPKFTLCWTEFLTLKVRVPCETQSYIEANYGKEWNTPVKVWDWKASPANVRPNGEWDKKDLDEVIQLL